MQRILGWILGHVTDAQGGLEEHHEPRDNGDAEWSDTDGDGIAKRYDNCPFIWNPEQLTTFDDPDKDGIGAACDHCPEDIGGRTHLDNRNYEVERAMAHRDGIVSEPRNPEDFPSTIHFQQARERWVAAYRPDMCDPTPVPLQSLEEGSLPSLPAPPSTCGFGFGCTTVVRNNIVIDGRSTPETAATNARMGLRFCDCRLLPSVGTGSLVGREQCMQANVGCAYEPAAYEDAASAWREIETLVQGTWTLGAEWLHAPATNFSTLWDFRRLGAPTVTTTSNAQSVKGILWATTRELIPPVADLPEADVRAYAASLGTGDAYWAHRSNEPRTVWYTKERVFCGTCPQGLQNPYYEVANPAWRTVIENGSMPFAAPTSSTVAHYEEVAAGKVRHVAASEPLSVLMKNFRDGDRFVRAIGLEGESVTRVLRADRLDALPSRVSFATKSTGPAVASGRGYAYSATKQRLYVMGGTSLRGIATNEGWTLDLETQHWTRYSIPATESVGQVLAAVYRSEDQAVYFLDRNSSGLRLRRWNAQRRVAKRVVQTLATFPKTWDPFARFDLAATPGGHLLLSAWGGTGSERTRVGFVKLSEEAQVSLAALAKSTTDIVDAPAAGETGYSMVRRASTRTEPYAVSSTFASMPAPTGTDLPAVHPH